MIASPFRLLSIPFAHQQVRLIQSLLLPKWTGWDPGSVTDDALSVFHPVLSRQRHTSARSPSSSASIFIPDAVENSHLLTRRRKTDAPVDLSYAVNSVSTPSPRPQIQSPREWESEENSGIVWKDLSTDDLKPPSQSSCPFWGGHTAVVSVWPEQAESETNLKLVSPKDKPAMILSVQNLS